MAHTPVPHLTPVTRLTAPCPVCMGELSVYVFTQATDWRNTTKGLELIINSYHHIGPHACYPAVTGQDAHLLLSTVDGLDGWWRRARRRFGRWSR